MLFFCLLSLPVFQANWTLGKLWHQKLRYFYLAPRVEVSAFILLSIKILNTLFIFDSLELSGTSDSRLTKIKNKYSFSINHKSIKK